MKDVQTESEITGVKHCLCRDVWILGDNWFSLTFKLLVENEKLSILCHCMSKCVKLAFGLKVNLQSEWMNKLYLQDLAIKTERGGESALFNHRISSTMHLVYMKAVYSLSRKILQDLCN